MGYTKNLLTEQMLGISKETIVCKKCNKKYLQEKQEQIAGFRDTDYDICPYCGQINGSSMSYEYDNFKINE